MEIRFKVKGDLWRDDICWDVPSVSEEAMMLMNEVYRSKPLFGGKRIDIPLAEDRYKITYFFNLEWKSKKKEVNK